VLRVVICAALVGCGGAATPATPPPPAPAATDRADLEAERAARAEQERKDQLAAAHRELEDEQSTALAATCDKPATEPTQPRCEPSCYRAEPADPRAGKKLGRAEIVHLVCRPAGAGDGGPIVFADEVGGAKVALRKARGRMPKPHRKGTWEAELAAAVGAALAPELERGEVLRVNGGWKKLTHPVTKERLRCVTVSHHVKAMRRALDACGGRGAIACEAAGNVAAHGINVVHYRLAEARRLHAAGKDTECQQAALEAIAVARGLPRWRQYVTLNVDQWKGSPRYRTRFDGILDEDTVFTTAIALGVEAQAVHADCGGAATPVTPVAQEQSFHTCW
jgi:hypothetical protein